MRNHLKTFLRDHFGFSRSETNGLLLFLPFLFLSVFSPYILKEILSTYSRNVIYEEKAVLAWKNELDNRLFVAEELIVNQPVHPKKKGYVKKTYKKFDFNANKVQYDQLISLGFKKRVAENWVNYIKAGGFFKNVKGLEKVYGISKKRISTLTSFISFEHATEIVTKSGHEKKKPVIKKKEYKITINETEINKTTQIDLQKIKGIGPKISERIIKFRNKLGGFHNMGQLKEVYGIDSAVHQYLLKYFVLTDSTRNQIKINEVDINSLKEHPYISPKIARIIVNYRGNHGIFVNAKELSEIHIMSDSLILKIAPYLLFE